MSPPPSSISGKKTRVASGTPSKRRWLPLPVARPLPPDSHIRKILDAGDASAAFSFREAILKVKLIYQEVINSTKEHVTLGWLSERQQRLSFNIPKVLYYTEEDDRNYTLVTRVPGQVLAVAWRSMGEDEKQHYARRIVEICTELSPWTSDAMAGIDGSNIAGT